MKIGIGDKVTFHFVPMHVCGGVECRCETVAAVQRPAIVYAIVDEAAEIASLTVDLEPEDLGLGYSPDQDHSAKATHTPPESGSWTPP